MQYSSNITIRFIFIDNTFLGEGNLRSTRYKKSEEYYYKKTEPLNISLFITTRTKVRVTK